MDKTTRFWALYYNILEELQSGLTLEKAATSFAGEKLEAAIYFSAFIRETK